MPIPGKWESRRTRAWVQFTSTEAPSGCSLGDRSGLEPKEFKVVARGEIIRAEGGSQSHVAGTPPKWLPAQGAEGGAAPQHALSRLIPEAVALELSGEFLGIPGPKKGVTS